jgi:hypothetical protein
VVDIGNYIVGPYNGSFDASLSVTFYNTTLPILQSPDQIIPLSQNQSSGVSTYFSLPDDVAVTSVFIPSNTSRLVLEMFASGNGDEESWYGNVPNEFNSTFQAWNISLPGEGSFRELLVYVDEDIAGVTWPFEVVFTGGICPGFWRKIVDYRTFDLPSYQIDLTPFLDKLKGSQHQVKFKLQGQPNTLENWYVSGHLQIWYSESLNSTSYTDFPAEEVFISPLASIVSTGQVAIDNTSFSVTTLASREHPYSLEYENRQSYGLLDNGSTFINTVFQKTNFETHLSSGYYLFSLETIELNYPDGSLNLNASLLQVFHRSTVNIIDGSVSLEHAEVLTTGTFFESGNANFSTSKGDTSVSLKYSSYDREYFRNVKASGTQILYNFETDEWIGLD